jgi:hypothetical protein
MDVYYEETQIVDLPDVGWKSEILGFVAFKMMQMKIFINLNATLLAQTAL